MKRNGYFTFQTITDIAGACGAISGARNCGMFGFTSHNNYLQKKLTNKYTIFLKFSARVGTIAHR